MLDFLQQNFLLAALVVASGGMLLWPALNSRRALSPTDATLKLNREQAVVIDVRTPAEFAAGHVPESINIPRGELKNRLKELEKYKTRPIIMNCATGARSNGACGDLAKLGFEHVFTLNGGMSAWTQAGLPVKKGAK